MFLQAAAAAFVPMGRKHIRVVLYYAYTEKVALSTAVVGKLLFLARLLHQPTTKSN